MNPSSHKRPRQEVDTETDTSTTSTLLATSVSSSPHLPPRPSKQQKLMSNESTDHHHQTIVAEVCITHPEVAESNITSMSGSISIVGEVIAPLMRPPSHPSDGLLKLPRVIASSLSSDYLVKRDIRALGVTCWEMLRSLNQCDIKESVSHRSAIERLDRSLNTSSELNIPLAHLHIGRFRLILFSTAYVYGAEPPSADLDLLENLYRLTDVRQLILSPQSFYYHRFQHPIRLPVQLEYLTLLTVIVLNQFQLKDCLRLKRITLPSTRSSGPLTSNMWPHPSPIRELLNVNPDDSGDSLQLPDDLRRVTFVSNVGHCLIGFTLPHSITDLVIHRWTDTNGCYRDLPFPRSLVRLVFTAEIQKNDFDLTRWSHLPATCVNLRLELVDDPISDEYHRYDEDPTEVTAPIVVPSFVTHLKISRLIDRDYGQWQRPILQLCNCSSLVALATDSFDDIIWPAINDSESEFESVYPDDDDDSDDISTNVNKLIRLKASVGIQHFLLNVDTIPDTIRELDLSAVRWGDGVLEMDLNELTVNFPSNMKLLRLPTIAYDTDESLNRRLLAFSRVLPDDCIVEGQSPERSVCYQYVGSELRNRFFLSHQHIIQIEQQRFDPIPACR